MGKKKLPISKRSILIASALVLAIGLPIAYFLWANTQEDASAWYSSSWLYRRSISVANSGSELTNEDVLIVYDTAALVTAGKLQSDCDDLRFVDSDDSTALAYWVEGGCNTTTTHIWVRIPTLPNGGKTIYMYYGNDTATNAEQTWTGKFYLMKTSACDTGWTTESNSGGDFYLNFPRPAATFGTTGGTSSHNHGSASLTTSTVPSGTNNNSSGTLGVTDGHSHDVSVPTETNSSVLPPYLDMIFCSINDLIVKQNMVTPFDATVPTGFTRFSSLDSALPRGNSSYTGTQGGSTSHTHNTTSANTGAPSATLTCTSGSSYIASSTHTHNFAADTTSSGTHIPEYIETIYGQADADIMAPSATIVMSNATPPLGWSSATAFTGYFPYGATSYGTTGGNPTHTHDISLTSNTFTADVGCGTANPKTSKPATHSHTVSGTTATYSNNPPYVETVFIQKKTSQSATVNSEEINNTVPNAPSALTTEELTNPTGVTDTTPEFSSLYTDPDSDNAAHYQIQVNTQADFLGTTMWDSTKTAATITHNTRSAEISYGNTPLSLDGTTYYWRMKYWDVQGGESSWSSVAQFTMDTANSAPNAPSALETDGSTNPIKVTTTYPVFTAIYSDPDADAGTHYQVQVNTTNTFDGTSMWDSTKTAMTLTNNTRSGNITYNGSALVDGTTYYWRIMFWDNGGLSSEWSSAQFTMSGPPYSPSSLETEGATNPTGVTDTTPEFTAIHTDPNQDAATHYQIQVNTNSTFDGTSMWDSTAVALAVTHNTRSSEISYNGTTLTLNGTIYYWRIRFYDSISTPGAWSTGTNSFTMATNNAPNAPSALESEGATNPIKVTDTLPEFSAIFTDTDATDTGASYQIQVSTTDTFGVGDITWDSTKTDFITPLTNGNRIDPPIEYGSTALALDGTTYYWRIKMWDNKDAESTWSATAQFTMSGPPNAPSNIKVDGMTNPTKILSTTPSFSAYHTDPNTDNAVYYEIHVNANNTFTGTVMWESTKSAMTSTLHNQYSPDITYAGTTLTGESEITYYWRVRFWDTDNNVSSWSDVGSFVDYIETGAYMKLEGLQLEGLKIN